MSRFLIVYSSKHGQTQKISRYISDKVKLHGHLCEAVEITEPEPELENFDRLIIGGSVYVGNFNKNLIGWAQRNRNVINRRDPAFFTVSLNAADKRVEARKDDQRLIKEFIVATGIKPKLSESIAGAINYLDYNFLIRFIMKRISRKANGPTDTLKNHELTDWKKVDLFVNRLLIENATPSLKDNGFSEYV